MKLPDENMNLALPTLIRAPRLREAPADRIILPKPVLAGTAPLEECLSKRRSTRDYSEAPLTVAQVSQLLWAAQGITDPGGLRTAPSAGAVYPLRTYVIAGNVENVPAGFYRYDADLHGLLMLSKGDKRRRMAKAAADQDCMAQCGIAVVLTAWMRRAVREFGEAAHRLAAMEAGHAGQNFCLQATALRVGAIGLGKFDSVAVKMLLRLPDDEEPLYLLLAGRV